MTQRKKWSQQLMAAIRLYHETTGVKLTVIGRHAINDARAWPRLISGGSLALFKADEFMDWLAGQGIHINPEGEPYVQEIKKPGGEESSSQQKSVESRREEGGAQ